MTTDSFMAPALLSFDDAWAWMQEHPQERVSREQGRQWLEHWLAESQLQDLDSTEQARRCEQLVQMAQRGLDLDAFLPGSGLSPVATAILRPDMNIDQVRGEFPDFSAAVLLLRAGARLIAPTGGEDPRPLHQWMRTAPTLDERVNLYHWLRSATAERRIVAEQLAEATPAAVARDSGRRTPRL